MNDYWQSFGEFVAILVGLAVVLLYTVSIPKEDKMVEDPGYHEFTETVHFGEDREIAAATTRTRPPDTQ